VANHASNTVSVIDTATNTMAATVAVGSGPKGVAVTPDGTRVYVANYYSYTVSVIDTAADVVTATVAVGSGPVAFGQFIGPPLPTCPATAALEGVPLKEYKLRLLYRFRDQVLAQTPTGRRYIDLFYHHQWEGAWLILRYPELRERARQLLERFFPTIRAILAQRPASMSATDLAAIEAVLEATAAKASPTLSTALRSVQAELQQGTVFEGLGIQMRGLKHLPR
jgi:YVTN family beta-propeller protein